MRGACRLQLKLMQAYYCNALICVTQESTYRDRIFFLNPSPFTQDRLSFLLRYDDFLRPCVHGVHAIL